MPDPQPIAILFDLDGVLIDSGPHHFAAWQRFAERHGLAMTADAFAESFGLPNRLIIPKLFVNRVLSVEQVEELGEEKEVIYRELAAHSLAYLPGAEELLRQLARDRRFVTGLFTSTPRSNLDFLSERLGFSRYLRAMVCGSDVMRGKPAPDGWLALAKKLAVDRQRAIVIEDAPAGIESAKAAKMRAIGLTTTHPEDKLGAADWVYAGPQELSADLLAGL